MRRSGLLLSLLDLAACFVPSPRGIQRQSERTVWTHHCVGTLCRRVIIVAAEDDEPPGFFESFIKPRKYKASEASGMSSPFDFGAIVRGIREGVSEVASTEGVKLGKETEETEASAAEAETGMEGEQEGAAE